MRFFQIESALAVLSASFSMGCGLTIDERTFGNVPMDSETSTDSDRGTGFETEGGTAPDTTRDSLETIETENGTEMLTESDASSEPVEEKDTTDTGTGTQEEEPTDIPDTATDTRSTDTTDTADTDIESDTSDTGSDTDTAQNTSTDDCGEGRHADGAICCPDGYHNNGSDKCVVDVKCEDPGTPSRDCNGRGTCRDDAGFPVCVCNSGWDGDTCSVCAENFHDDGGECCVSGFHNNGFGVCVLNETCADPGPDSSDCSSRGSCSDTATKILCVCDTGWDGDTCSYCASGYHNDDGLCCKTGYHNNGEETCVVNVECIESGAFSIDCNSHGACSDTTGEPVCTCDTGWALDDCATCRPDYHLDEDECCPTNFHNDGTGTCLPDVKCADPGPSSSDCNGRGSCDDSSGNPICLCDKGWGTNTCAQCDIGWTGDQCDTCGTGYDGEDCDACVQGYVWDGDRHCLYCDPAWGVLDTHTGLCWQKDADEQTNWYRAGGIHHGGDNPDDEYYCGDLTLGGATAWRLPDLTEYFTVIRGCTNGTAGTAETLSACECEDNACERVDWSTCQGCPVDLGPDAGCYRLSGLTGPCDFYWSMSSEPGFGHGISFKYGNADSASAGWLDAYVRCVLGVIRP